MLTPPVFDVNLCFIGCIPREKSQVFWRPGLCASSLHVQKGMRGRRFEVRGHRVIFLGCYWGWNGQIFARGLKCWFVSFHIHIYIYECRWQLDDNEHIVINMCSFGIWYSFKGVFQWHIFILSSPQSWRCISYIHPRLDKIGIDLQRIEPWPSKHRSVDRLWLSLVEFWSGHLKINQSGKLGNFPMTWGETCKLSLPKLIRFHGRQWFQLIPKRPTKFQLPKGWTNPGKLT